MVDTGPGKEKASETRDFIAAGGLACMETAKMGQIAEPAIIT